MNIFEIKCACGGFILGPREGGKARGRWLGYDTCLKCRAPAPVDRSGEAGETPLGGSTEGESAVTPKAAGAQQPTDKV